MGGAKTRIEDGNWHAMIDALKEQTGEGSPLVKLLRSSGRFVEGGMWVGIKRKKIQMEPMLTGQALAWILAWILAFIFVAPIAVKGVALDAKLDPEEGEDETRVVKIKEINARANRSFSRRWLRAANYREENILRVSTGSRSIIVLD